MKRCCLILAHIAVYATFWSLSPIVMVAWTAPLVATLLIWISIRDIETFEIPDAAVVLLGLVAILHLLETPRTLWPDKLAGVVFWPTVFFLAAKGFRHRHGYDGLGFGDVKLMAPLALLCGFSGTIYLVLGASVSGLITLTLFMARKNSAVTTLKIHALAFAPFLCFWGWAVWLRF